MIETKGDATNEMAIITRSGVEKESPTLKGLPLISDLKHYIIISSETPGSLLIHIKLRKNNYDQWSIAFLGSLMPKRKDGFIDGAIKNPAHGT